jgi:hypothetical protein
MIVPQAIMAAFWWSRKSPNSNDEAWARHNMSSAAYFDILVGMSNLYQYE